MPVGGSAQNGYPASVQTLIDELARLPGIGTRTAERLAFHLLKLDAKTAKRLSRAIDDVKDTVRHCTVCFNFADAGVCRVCADETRDRSSVMVVEQPGDLIAIEQTGMWKGVYHVLLGRVSPLEGVRVEDVTIFDLLARVDQPESNAGGERVREVVLALNPTLEGDGTALHLTGELERRGVNVSRLARGLPAGGQIGLSNKAVLADAIAGRRPV
jgi:recombination protein RecR